MVLLAGDVRVVAWPIDGPRPPDLALVDALARLQLAARRLGLSVHVQSPGPRLTELLDLVGLTDVLVEAPGSGVEPGREPERREQLGIEEVVQPGDAAV